MDLGIRVRRRALANGGGSVVHANLATTREFGDRVQCVGEGSVATFHARNCEGMVFADDIVPALLTVGRQVAVGEMITGKALVAEDAGVFNNSEREARKPAHVDFVGS